MKRINLLALLAVISVIIVGCINTGNKDKANQTMIDLSAVHSITIQNDSGESMTITDNNLIEQFNETIHTAEYDSAKLDIATPDYEAIVEMKNKENAKFSFWISGENNGLITKSGQNGHYKLPETEKAVLLHLFQSNDQQAETDNLKIDEDIKRITIADSLAHGSVNANIKEEYIDHETIEIFVRAIRNAVQIPGNLNTATPNYDIVLISDNNKYAFHLWINESSEQGMLMNVNETSTGYTLTKESTAELKKITFMDSTFKGLEFNAVRSSNGDLVAKPMGISENNYILNGGAVVELQGITYHTIHFFYGDHNAINALLAHDPATDEVKVKWSDELNDSNNRWNNAFMNNYNMLIPLDGDHLLFLESDLTKEAGEYHLSSYNVVTGKIERLREDFWPLSDDYDYIYKFQWKADEQKLFMQSYLGNVWIFDLKKGQDDVHLLKYRVIPHSTTGAPSLFLSPTFKRFVHDDESGQLTFYDNKGASLHTVPLPQERYVPSEKIKWNPAGTIAWMDTAEVNQNRIHDIDIDYLKIAPQIINFYNQDGLPICTIMTESDHEDAAVEVVGWMDANIAVMKSYSVELLYKDTIGLKVKNVSYYLYDVKKKQRGASISSIPSSATVTPDHQMSDADNERNITVSFKEITYKKGN
ncbi:hypothetical protein MHB77_05350 [Paenibacillus sp. FSL K6-3166]|uniref:hypothetical protein n=1 Tax=Paenibacillus TaxID=44249 RepID=UPI000BA17CC9|nr:hypothetical protein [Paenibacillus sp. VTT E-133291]OZQ98613.1 hypothetical protein CA598_00840 [Paenibacillus sp. VTT E-133291]